MLSRFFWEGCRGVDRKRGSGGHFFVQSLICCWAITAWRQYMETRACSHFIGVVLLVKPEHQLVRCLGSARVSTGR